MSDKLKYFIEAWEMNSVGQTVATVQDSPGTVVTITVDDLRALLARQPAAIDKGAATLTDDARNLVTLDRRDLWDYVRGAIHAALNDKIPKNCVVSWAWEEATNRTMDIFQAIVDAAPLANEASKPAAPSVEQDERGALPERLMEWRGGAGLLWDVYAFGKWSKRIVSPIEWDAHTVYLDMVRAGYAKHIELRLVSSSNSARPDDRASFEAAWSESYGGGNSLLRHHTLTDKYANHDTQSGWEGWKLARAASTSANVAQQDEDQKMNTSDLISTEMDSPRRVVLTFRTGAAAEQFLAASTSANVAQGAEAIYQILDPIEGGWSDGPRSLYDATDGAFKRVVYAAPPAQSALTDDVLMQAIADTAARGHVWASRALSNFRAAVREAAKSPDDA
ncbi:hypothetical protein [Paraburkholderia strydomiana]|uniref:Uncharacterized protein n=1 Tax=Paraburkholderia strydomiana TaxID=1245417 RepID=A0ABW9C1H6_9BURK